MLPTRPQWPALLFLISAALSLFGYLLLKHFHIRLVYQAAKYIKEQNQCGAKAKYVVSGLAADSGREVRLVFWDGKFVGSAMAPEGASDISNLPVVRRIDVDRQALH